ncbi:unnamed protein product [Nezara viridula]|uniref:Uncharacterized protein n=1 Tax=Nezara viridula TaxID=85310 RepID=A0A9P0HJD7_NEZVI|nr:unnamed protein product [Nezara viridula]CAH1402844.1 unnamed protein product [Nezara viridula]
MDMQHSYDIQVVTQNYELFSMINGHLITFLSHLQTRNWNIFVIYYLRGLWFGSCGTIPKRTRSFLKELGVDIKDVARLAENIVLDSLGIIHHHVHG